MKPDTNTVKVNVDKLVPRSSADVEMLSAKVENVQKESIQKTEPEKVKETMKYETKCPGQTCIPCWRNIVSVLIKCTRQFLTTRCSHRSI
jgi:hypothetical protein